MLEIEKIKHSGFFKEIVLEENEILFSQGDCDEYMYVVYDGELIVEKSMNLQKDQYKTLGVLGIGNIVGEAALTNSAPKQVQIRASRKTILLSIHGQKEFKKFVRDNPLIGYNFLTNIIEITNTRLLRANRELTANYEVNVAISKIKDFSAGGINKLLLVFQSILEVDQILFFEKNLVMDEYFKLKCNSKDSKILQNKIIKFPKEIFNIEVVKNENIYISKYYIFTKLKLGNKNYGFLVAGKEQHPFHDNEEKLLQNTAASFVAIIHQKEILEEQRNKNYIQSLGEI